MTDKDPQSTRARKQLLKRRGGKKHSYRAQLPASIKRDRARCEGSFRSIKLGFRPFEFRPEPREFLARALDFDSSRSAFPRDFTQPLIGFLELLEQSTLVCLMGRNALTAVLNSVPDPFEFFYPTLPMQ
jgi:hypothetical protein